MQKIDLSLYLSSAAEQAKQMLVGLSHIEKLKPFERIRNGDISARTLGYFQMMQNRFVKLHDALSEISDHLDFEIKDALLRLEQKKEEIANLDDAQTMVGRVEETCANVNALHEILNSVMSSSVKTS